jgi:hypothetical protein
VILERLFESVVRSYELTGAVVSTGLTRLQSVLMRSLPQGWRLSAHAEEQMVERAVAPSELVLCLSRPERVTPDPKGEHPDMAYWWHGSMGALVDTGRKIVVTILIDGADSADWEAAARSRRSSHQADAEALMRLLRPETRVHDRKPVQRRTARPKVHAVQSVNILDRTTRRLYDLALKQAGGDAKRIRVHGPGRIEILPEAS